MQALTQNILVPTDFSKASALALGAAAILARQNGAKVTIAHVWEPRGVLLGGPAGTDVGHAMPAELESEIHARLEEIATTQFSEVSSVKTALVLAPSADRGIVDYAKKENVDMIVLSTHGRSGIGRIFIGSVAERVVRHAPCPVLTLRSKALD